MKRNQLYELYLVEDEMLKQRLKEDWLWLMDKKRKYFYNVLKAKRKRTQILFLENELGSRLVEEKDIQDKAISFMRNMLGVESSSSMAPDPGIIKKGMDLTSAQQHDLAMKFDPNDFKNALMDIDDLKAPYPDGYFAYFFKKAWSIVGEEITNTILGFFRSSHLLHEVYTGLRYFLFLRV